MLDSGPGRNMRGCSAPHTTYARGLRGVQLPATAPPNLRALPPALVHVAKCATSAAARQVTGSKAGRISPRPLSASGVPARCPTLHSTQSHVPQQNEHAGVAPRAEVCAPKVPTLECHQGAGLLSRPPCRPSEEGGAAEEGVRGRGRLPGAKLACREAAAACICYKQLPSRRLESCQTQ